MVKPLTDRRKVFCEEYIVNLNATEAALKAGFSEKGISSRACQLLKSPDVKAYIGHLMSERTKRTQIDADYVINSIVETIERCKQAEPVLDKKGNPVMIKTATGEKVAAFTFQAGQVLKGAELLGKHLKMFTDVSEHKFTLTEMGRVMVEDYNGSKVPLEFNVGKDPNDIIDQ